MITKRTVLILGAGSNTHLGYPLGTGLVSEICSRAKQKHYSNEIGEKFTHEQIETFRRRLSRSMFPSIDTFLEQNQDDSELGRLFIADCLKQHEDEDKMFPPNDPGWYRNLFTALATPKVEDLTEAPLTIITFNYDRSLEVFLHQAIKHRYHLSDNDACQALKSIPMIHPHGILGEYPGVPYRIALDGMSLSALAEQISIIYELQDGHDGFCNDAFREGNNALQQAELVVFLGFGFHDDNVRRFKFFSPESLKGKQIVGTLMVPGPQRPKVLQQLDKYGLSSVQFYNHIVASFFATSFEFA